MEDGSLEGIADLSALGNADSRNQTMRRLHDRLARIHEHEATGTVRILSSARLKAPVAKQRCLLIAGNAHDGGHVRHDLARYAAKITRTPADLGHHGARNIEVPQQIFVPLKRIDVEEHRTARVGVVGCIGNPAGEVVDKPGVDGSKHQLAGLGSLVRAAHIVENPSDLGARKIRIRGETGLSANFLLVAVDDKLLGERRRTAALPHDGVVYGLAAVAIPHHGGFTLVADADGGDAIGMDAAFELDFHHHGNLRGKNLHRILLHPARMRTDGLERFGRLGNDATVLVHNHGAHRSST